jgi:hypothetical protein
MPSGSTVTEAGIGAPAPCFRIVNVAGETLAADTAAENVAEMDDVVDTPVAPSAGATAETLIVDVAGGGGAPLPG